MKKHTTLACSTLGLFAACTHHAAYAEFLNDSKATLSMRNLYFNSDNRDGAAAPNKTEEWAQGFLLNYTSGFTEGTVGFGLDSLAMLGVTLDSGAGRHVGSSMIPSDGEGAAAQWGRIEPTAKMRLAKTEARYGTLQPKIPVLMASDGRLLPQTFQGGQVTSKDLDNFTFTGGLISQVTGRGSTDRTGLSVVGGTQDSNKFYFAGTDYKAMKNLTLQYYFARLDDYYDQHFFGLQHVWTLDAANSVSSDLRYFKTDSNGANASASGRAQGYAASGYSKDRKGEIDNDTWSAYFTYTHLAHSLTLGYQSVSDGSNFIQENQGSLVDKGAGGSSYYLFTDRMLQSFVRAGEQTVFGQYAYDFAPLGVPGLRASMVYLKGTGIKTYAGPEQSEWERDVALEYVVQSGTFKGLGVAWKNGMARTEAGRNGDQNRLIFNYTLALF
ncbi:OprD family porin [Pseudomonas silvicola]|nr:OprD family porin [Pseudomonas silvicola]